MVGVLRIKYTKIPNLSGSPYVEVIKGGVIVVLLSDFLRDIEIKSPSKVNFGVFYIMISCY